MTTGTVISKIIQVGYIQHFEYPSHIRGGHNTVETVFRMKKLLLLNGQWTCLSVLNKIPTISINIDFINKVSLFDPKI
jgi:hypothetical protein